jgi:hypothetical protein
MTTFVLDHFYEMTTPKHWQEVEKWISKHEEYYGTEGILIYSMRIAWAVPKITVLSTLGSRYEIIFSGSDDHPGIHCASQSPNFPAVHDFLQNLCKNKFLEIASAQLQKKGRALAAARQNVEVAAQEMGFLQELKTLYSTHGLQ